MSASNPLLAASKKRFIASSNSHRVGQRQPRCGASPAAMSTA
jgi:hypothetical protein